jgi:hypothetical protein
MAWTLPTPLHGWRAFFGEVGVILIGVLLALGAQQAVESVNQRREAADTRTALTSEIKETLAVMELRRRTYRTPTWVSQATWFAIGTQRFDAAESAGRLALLSSEEQYRIGLVHGGLVAFRAIQLDETNAWSRLRLLQSGADALSASDRTAARTALQDASVLNYLAKIRVGQTLEQAASYGWRPEMERVRQSMRLAWKDGKFAPTICLPIDTPAEQANRETGMLYDLPE